MTDNRKSGLAMIAGQAGLILTLSLHPRGGISPAHVEEMVRKLLAVHSLGLASLPFMVLGALGLSMALASRDRLSIAGFVFYGFAIAALLSGIVVDGLVMPQLLRQIVAGGALSGGSAAAGATAGGAPAAGSADLWRTIFKYNGFLDIAFVQVSLVASAVAVGIWSVAILRGGALPRGVGVFGLLLGVLAVVAVFTGVLGSEHAISVILLGEAVWFLIVGGMLCWMADRQAAS